ncbi:MAG TPA: NUDIX domain-containing protein [Rhizomicrobium sp.]|nr:NUDIX domain-containing protein [Rhizomicrobium sp.]
MTQQLFDADEQLVAGPALRPKDAATLIIMRRDKDGLRVLMGQRAAKMAFQPNKFVFPGGRIDPCDLRIHAGGALRPDVAAQTEAGITPARARGLALTAIRETFEETGVLIGEKSADLPRTRAPVWRRYFGHGIVPRLDLFTLVARAITPPGRPRRFDARFFMVDATAIAGEVDASHHEELLRPAWLTLTEARALDLMSITRRVLEEAEARAQDGGTRPVPFFRFTRGKAHVSYL